MKSWKTTTAALISAGASLLQFLHSGHYIDLPPVVAGIIAFTQIGGVAGLGIMAKDSDVTGGTVAQTPEAATRVQEDKV